MENTWKEFMRAWRTHKVVYSPNAARDTKLSIARIPHLSKMKIILDPLFYARWAGLSQKTISRCFPLNVKFSRN
jgi:hypothetical protein